MGRGSWVVGRGSWVVGFISYHNYSVPPSLNRMYYYYYFIPSVVYISLFMLLFYYQRSRLEILETDKTLQNHLTDKDFLPANRRRWNLITINLFPMYINFQQQFCFKNVQLTSVSAMTKAASANTCISVIFNQSRLGIATLPNEQPHGRYKTDA